MKKIREKYVSHWTAEKIRNTRKFYGLSQTEFAERLQVRQQTISEWELGIYLPKRTSTFILDTFLQQMEALNSKL